jgi:hypothetical protein
MGEVIHLLAQWRHRRAAGSLPHLLRLRSTPNWRLSERRNSTAELYDHSTDRAEYHNLITNPDHAALVKRLHGMVEVAFGPSASDQTKAASNGASSALPWTNNGNLNLLPGSILGRDQSDALLEQFDEADFAGDLGGH